jgi:PAS domain S-box-containing protein
LDSRSQYYFLDGGGELGKLTREFPWHTTPLGPVEDWPEALKATVGIILHTDFPMFLWWGDDLIQFYNDGYRPSLGQDGKHPKALGQKGVDCWPEIWHIIFPLIEQVRMTGKSFFFENQLVPIFRNGKVEDVYWTFSYSSVIGKSGSIDGVLVVCTETSAHVRMLKDLERNVTDLNLAKGKVERSERNFRNMVKQSPVAMCIMMGPDHIVEVANDKIIELWGKSQEQVMSKPIFEGLPDARGQGLEELLANVYREGDTVHANERPVVLLRNGKEETVYQNFVYEPYRDSDGNIVGVLAITIDVTEQVVARLQIEDVVRERTESLRKTNEELSRFAYVASHDLQEPVRKIRVFVELLQKTLGPIDARSSSYLTKIDSAANRMLDLIRGILELSRLADTGRKFESVDLNAIVDEIKAEFELLIEEKGCVIEVERLPVIQAIRIQMTQLFGNLVSNSLKFLRPGMPLCVSITSSVLSETEKRMYPNLRTGKDYWKIAFSDNGIGFEQNNAEHIFEVFQRLHSSSEYRGTGIGLATAKKIVENHHGHIYAESRPGSGATFTVILPEVQ